MNIVFLIKVKVYLLMLKGRPIPLMGTAGYSLLNENRYFLVVKP